jgi:DNA polymerase I-like protein with 3'-5' exonuclease and polymerase domains
VTRVRQWLGIRPERPTATSPVREIEPYRPFPTAALPEPMREYVRQGAIALGCDVAYAALPALAVAAGLIGYTRVLRLKRSWRVPPVLWTMVVADSGSLKTPAARLTADYLFTLQKRLDLDYQRELEEYVAAREQWAAAAKAAKNGDGDPPGDEPKPPLRRTVFTSDATIEAIAELIAENPRGLTVSCDELAGWFGSFSRYKGAAGGTDLPRWLSMHSAGGFAYHRKTGERRRIVVPHAAVSIAGGIQPGILAQTMSNEFLAAGLAARLLIAWPPRPAKVWSECEIDPDTEQRFHGLLDELYALSFDRRDGEDTPHILTLAPDAKAVWEQWYNAWGREQAGVEGELAAAYSKLEEAAARFALVHHAVTLAGLGCDDTAHPVGVTSIESGITLARWFAAEARRVYSILNESDDRRDGRRLVEFIRARGGRITVRRLHQSNTRKYQDADQARAALDKLAQAGLGYWTRPEIGPKGGQPAVWFVLNPCTTPNTTYSTDENEDDGDGLGAQHYPPPPDVNPQNSQENPGTVGSVGRCAGVHGQSSGGGHSPAAGALVSGTTGVVLGARGGDDGPVDAASPYVLVTNPTELAIVTTVIGESSLVGLDTETTGLDPRTDRLRLLSLCCDTTDGGTVTYLIDSFAADPSPLWETLSMVPVVGHNLVFDHQFLVRLGFEPGECRDTLLMSQALYAGDRSQKHSLAACVERELGEVVDKGEQLSDWSGALTPEQLRYAARDAALTRRLHDALVPKLAEARLTDTVAIENRAMPAVAWLSSSGVGFDKVAWQALADGAQAEAERLAGELDRAAPPRSQGEMFGSGWKWDSPQHVAEALKAIGHAVEGTDDNTLAALDHPLAALLRDYRAARKLAGTYGSKWLKGRYAGGRVYAGWRQLGANGGRMACSTPNLQNLPRDARYRRCFTAPPGRVLVKADYSQIELRLAAKVAGEGRMIAAYRRGDDLHTLTARTILGKEAVTKADRQLAKAVNFGLLYGMSAKGFRRYARSNYGVELTEVEARQYRDAFFTAYPGLKRWHARVGRTKDQAIETRTQAGRRCLNVTWFNEKLNLGIQGTGADGLKAALALLWQRRAECPGALPVLAVHDEIVVECDADLAVAAAAWLKQAMLDDMAPLAAPVPVEVEVTIAPTWGG